MALSKQSPTVPIEGAQPRFATAPAEGKRGVLGGFNRSSQHLKYGGVKWEDDEVGPRNKQGGQ